MKYFFIIFSFLYFIGCEQQHNNNDNNKHFNEFNENKIKTIKSPQTINKSTSIKIGDLTFHKEKNNITYSFQKPEILLFIDENQNSKLQLSELKKLNTKFYIIKNVDLINFFNITTYPTIIITDGKKTKKYVGFIPAVMLKYEIKD